MLLSYTSATTHTVPVQREESKNSRCRIYYYSDDSILTEKEGAGEMSTPIKAIYRLLTKLSRPFLCSRLPACISLHPSQPKGRLYLVFFASSNALNPHIANPYPGTVLSLLSSFSLPFLTFASAVVGLIFRRRYRICRLRPPRFHRQFRSRRIGATRACQSPRRPPRPCLDLNRPLPSGRRPRWTR